MLDIGTSRLGGHTVRLAFYEWAYGKLGEADVDVGALGEFVAGLYVGGLAGRRRETGDADLVAADGRTIEVKTTTGVVPGPRNKSKVYRWNIADQRRALAGERPLSDLWIFLVADFPAQSGRFFNVFAPELWTAYVLPGADVRRLAGASVNFLGAATIRKAGFPPLRLDELPARIAPSPSPLAAQARENTDTALPLLRLAYFRWAYGDLHDTFNSGRLAEFQVMRLVGRRPFTSRSAFGAADLVSRRGFRLEVKFSRTDKPHADGTPCISFLLTTKRHFNPDNFDFAVLCHLSAPDADPLPLANWVFRWVPAQALRGNRTRVNASALDRQGHTPLDAAGLQQAECTANLPNGDSPLA